MAQDNEEFGELALILGDLHINTRSADIPLAFKELLVPNKVHYVLCTGNIGNTETHNWIKTLSPNSYFTKGVWDTQNFKDFEIVQIGTWKLLLINGYQIIPANDQISIANLAQEHDVDAVIVGNTHVQSVETVQGKHIINPGSATGAYNAVQQDIKPGFIIVEFQAAQLKVYSYTLEDEVKYDLKILLKI